MGLEALLRGWISRALPQADTDNDPGVVRLWRYGEVATVGIIRKQHALADEGSYFITNNAQTAITGQTSTAFTATAPTLMVVNTDSANNSNNKRIHLDYAYLINGGTAFSNATSNTGTFIAVVVDSVQRYTSGGTNLSANIVSPNADAASRASIAAVYCGAIVASAAAATARTVVGQRLLRAPVSATVLTLANLDQFKFNFGGVEAAPANSVQASATLEATMVDKTIALPPIVIGPGQCALIYVFSVAGGAVTAGNFVPELGWWER